jgi:uncharacterized protein (UPF0248 family)
VLARKSEIREAVKRALWQLREGFQLCYVHRDQTGQRVKCVESSNILYADSWAVHLVDDTTIPYHRIVMIKDRDGRILWVRGEGWSGI